MDIYQDCPLLENETLTLRLICNTDTADLLKVYSDPKAVPLFNSDNCHGDDFYYKTMERMQQAVDFWVEAYEKRWFVRWTIVDRKTNETVGTIEAFHRASTDCYNDYGLFRIDLRGDHENQETIASILNLLAPNMYNYFDCTKCMTKAEPNATARVQALKDYGFTKSDIPMIGWDGTEYTDYWVMSQK